MFESGTQGLVTDFRRQLLRPTQETNYMSVMVMIKMKLLFPIPLPVTVSGARKGAPLGGLKQLVRVGHMTGTWHFAILSSTLRLNNRMIL